MSYYSKMIKRGLEAEPLSKAGREYYDKIRGKYDHEGVLPGSCSSVFTVDENAAPEHFVMNSLTRKKRPNSISEEHEHLRPPKMTRAKPVSPDRLVDPRMHPARLATQSRFGEVRPSLTGFGSSAPVVPFMGSGSAIESWIEEDKMRTQRGADQIERQSGRAAQVRPVIPDVVESAKCNDARSMIANERNGTFEGRMTADKASQRETEQLANTRFQQLRQALLQQLNSQSGVQQHTLSNWPETYPASSQTAPSPSTLSLPTPHVYAPKDSFPATPGSLLVSPRLPLTVPDGDSPLFVPKAQRTSPSSESRIDDHVDIEKIASSPLSCGQLGLSVDISQPGTVRKLEPPKAARKAQSTRIRPKCEGCSRISYNCNCLDEKTAFLTYARCDPCRRNRLLCKPSDIDPDCCKSCWVKSVPCIYTPAGPQDRAPQQIRKTIADDRLDREAMTTTELKHQPIGLTQLSAHAIPAEALVERASEGQKCPSEAWRQAYLEELDAEEREAHEIEHEEENKGSSTKEQSKARIAFENESSPHFIYRVHLKRWDTGQDMTEDDVEDIVIGETHTDLQAANEAVLHAATQNLTLRGKYCWEVDGEGMFTVLTKSGTDDEPGPATRAWLQRDVRVSALQIVEPESLRLPKKAFVVYERVCLIREPERRGDAGLVGAANKNILEAQIEAALANDSIVRTESGDGTSRVGIDHGTG